MSEEIYSFLMESPKFCDDIFDDLKCLLCQNVMINVFHTPCGCEFCKVCIANYLKDESKICPGNTEECGSQLINFNDNVHPSPTSNKKIKKLRVICPNKDCNHIDPISEMIAHIRICEYKLMNCPYSEMGCVKDEFDKLSLDDHMRTETSRHQSLISHVTIEIRDEHIGLKDQLENTNNQINQFQVNLNEDKSKTIKIEEQMQLNSDKIQTLINTIKETKEENDGLKNELQRIRDINHQMESVNSSLKVSQDQLKSQIEVHRTIYEFEMNEKLTELKKEVKTCKKLIEEKSKELKDVDLKMVILENKMCNHNNILTHFDFKVDKLTERREKSKLGLDKDVYSEAFYRYGYKLRIFINPDGQGTGKGTHVSVYFQILSGDYDNLIGWPCCLEIKLGLVNHDTNIEESVRSYQLESTPERDRDIFYKPKSLKNDPWGHPRFMDWNLLVSNSQLFRDDSIIIRCTTLPK